MSALALSAAALVCAVLVARWWLLYRPRPGPVCEPFDGVVYAVGDATVAERASLAPRATVLCMHGFVESPAYFTGFYADPSVQLVLISSADYHPLAAPVPAPWAKLVTAAPGTIEYDAAVLVQALEHLPKTRSIRVHGHSRGAAVVLEASVLRPELFRDVEVLLDTPVLPQARVRGRTTALMLWLLPFFVPLWRAKPITARNAKVWGRLDDARKRALVMSLPFNPRRAITIARGLESMKNWQARTDERHYAAVRGAVIIAGDDRVLDSRSMRASAERAKGLRIIDAPSSSHFVLFDSPEVVPPLR
jgi:pimeloyl-ACP methyl ester carboxylesterase